MNNNQQQKTSKLKKRISTRKRWIIGITVLLLLVSGVVGVWFFLNSQKKPTSQQDQPLNQETHKTISNAQVLASNGKVDAAKMAYDTAIKNTNDNSQKSILFSQKATLLFNKRLYDEALVAALQAESAQKDAAIESFIAQIYEKKGDKQQAIVYYQKAILLVDSSQAIADSDIQYYKSVIHRLGGVAN